jgi:hypothetical protein
MVQIKEALSLHRITDLHITREPLLIKTLQIEVFVIPLAQYLIGLKIQLTKENITA